MGEICMYEGIGKCVGFSSSKRIKRPSLLHLLKDHVAFVAFNIPLHNYILIHCFYFVLYFAFISLSLSNFRKSFCFKCFHRLLQNNNKHITKSELIND